MIVRLLVLTVAMLLVAAPAERARAELCPDTAAEVVSVDAPFVQLPAADAVPSRAKLSLASSADYSIAPAPSGARIFRPPRGSLVSRLTSL